MQPLEGLSYKELRLLEEVDSSPDVSQRQLANQVGIALGVANLLVRSLAKKGYIKVSQVGWKRWVYVLTPAGVARKFQLTLSYIERFMDHYKRIRVSLQEQFSSIPLNTESRIAICGTTELAELVYLALRDMGVTHIDAFASGVHRPKFLGMQVGALATLTATAQAYSRIVVADSSNGISLREVLVGQGVDPALIVTPLDGRKGSSGNGREKSSSKSLPANAPDSNAGEGKNGERNGSGAKALVRNPDQT